MRHYLLFGVVVSLFCQGIAYAGNGTITDVEKDSDGYVRKARVELLIYVDEPRTTEEMDTIQTQLKRASQNVCDYTEGVFHLSKVRFSSDPSDKKNADVWWMRIDQGGSWSAGIGVFGHDNASLDCNTNTRTLTSDSGRIYMSSIRHVDPNSSDPNDKTGLVFFYGETFAHELGHLVFNQRDEYGDARSDNHNRASGVYGHNRIADPYTGNMFFRAMGGNDLMTEPVALAGDQSPLRMDSTSPLYGNGNGSNDFWWKINPGVMQQYQQGQCRRSDGRTPNDVNPIFMDANHGCATDDDCADSLGYYFDPTDPNPSNYNQCSIAPSASELTMSEAMGVNRYNLTMGRHTDIKTVEEVSRIQKAQEIVLQGLLVPTYYFTYPEPSTGKSLEVASPDAPSGWSVSDGAKNDEFLCSSDKPEWKACPNNAGGGNDSVCFGHVPIDTSNCPAAMGASVCGNNTIDYDSAGSKGEECDTGGSETTAVTDPDTGADLTCDNVYSAWRVKAGESRANTVPSLKFNNKAKVYCRKNCTFDLSRCSLPLAKPVAGTTLKQLKDSSHHWLWNEVFDANGEVLAQKHPDNDSLKVPFDQIGPSNHILFAFMRRVGRSFPDGRPTGKGTTLSGLDAHDLWEVTFAMDASEFGGTLGDAHILNPAPFQIEFATDINSNLGPVKTVNGVANSADWPKIKIEGLTRGDSASLELKLILDNLSTVRTNTAKNGVYGDLAGRSHMYARFGTKAVGNTVFESPQYGSIFYRIKKDRLDNGGSCGTGDVDCKNEARFWELVGYNAETGRFDTSRAALEAFKDKYWDHRNDSEASLIALLDQDQSSTLDSGWKRLGTNMCDRFGLKIPVPTQVSNIKSDPPDSSQCPDPQFDTSNVTTTDFDEKTQIVFVLDRSGSMAEEGQDFDGSKVDRLDFVKMAALQFLEDMSWNLRHRRDSNADGDTGDPGDNKDAKGPKIGVLWFSDNAEARIPQFAKNARSCTQDSDCNDTSNYEVRICTTAGKCKAQMPRLECAGKDSVCHEPDTGTYELTSRSIIRANYMRPNPGPDSNVTDPQQPEPNGWTATGSALQEAIKLFDPDTTGATPDKKAIVLLTDGFHNRPSGGTCWDGKPYVDTETCWPGSNADEPYKAAIASAKSAGIQFYTIPLGVSGDRSSKSITDGTLNGEVFPTQSRFGEDTIPAFHAVYASLKGQQLVRAPEALPVMKNDNYLTPTEYEIPVETGASVLHVGVSQANLGDDLFWDYAELLRLVSPSGAQYNLAKSDYRSYVSRFASAFHVPKPEAGKWVVTDYVGTLKEDRKGRLAVSAFVETSELYNCDANTDVAVSDGTHKVRISAQASGTLPVARGDTYSVLLQRPDKTVATFSLKKDEDGKPSTADVGPDLFRGDGTYVATIACKVSEGATLVKGERESPEIAVVSDPLTTHAFTRQVHAYFQVSGSGVVALPGVGGDNQDPAVLGSNGLPSGYSPVRPYVGDCDGDGIPNDQEPAATVDSDGDGKPDVCDSDSNGNEVTDGLDPGIPYSPVADGTGTKCSMANAATCCVSIDRCVGGLSSATVFAQGSLALRDRAKVLTNANGSAIVLNAGAAGTSLGVEAKAANVRAAGNVELRDRASVSGDVLAAGDITLGNGATVGSGYANSSVRFPNLLNFSITIPSGTTNIEAQQGQSKTAAPGTYNRLTAYSGGTIYLASGTYYVQSLDIEPQGVLAVNMSGGPIYLYVANSVIYRGTILLTGGVASNLFIGYMGTQFVALEVPFTGTFVAPKASLAIGPVNGGGLFVGGFFAKDIEVRPDVEVRGAAFAHVWLSSSSTGGGGNSGGNAGGTSFTCAGSCLNATTISRYQFSGNFNTTDEVWYVTSDAPTGWQASNVDGRQIYVNGVVESSGQMPLPAAVNGKYYFQFTAGGVAWANWSFW